MLKKVPLKQFAASGKPILVLCVWFLFSATQVMAQEDDKKVYTSTKNARAYEAYSTSTNYLIQKKYNEVEILCKNAVKWDSNYIDAYMRLSNVYYVLDKKDEEEKMYKRVIEIRPEFPDAYFNYGALLLNSKRYDEAIAKFNIYLKFDKLPPKFIKKAYWNIELSKFRNYAYEHPVPFDPVNLGNGINTAVEEYWPVLTADDMTLFFTRRVKLDTNRKFGRYNFNEDVYVSTLETNNWIQAISIPGFLNSPNYNEGALSITPDGRYMYFTICSERVDFGYGSCDIYFSESNQGRWSQPKNLGPVINSTFKETQPSISFDGNTLYFASDRDGSYGKLDIWRSTKDASGRWTTPVNVGESINTEGNEQSPFIHPDDHTLFFSTNQRIGMGGSDLYVARKDNNGNFYGTKNLGYPINTENDEISLFVSSHGKKAYFASNTQGHGFGELDIYSFDLYPEVRPRPVCYLKGVVYDAATNEKLGAKFELVNVENGSTILVAYSEDKTGKFLEAIPSNANYMLNVSKKGYMFYSEHLPIKNSLSSACIKDIPLQPIQVGQSIILNNIFFDFDLFNLKDESVAELKKLIDFLNDYPNVKVEISGHTDSKGSDTYNLTLSESRAKAVYEYLISIGKISKDRLTYKGYGEAKPIDSNETDQGRANNRRTEFKITGI